MMTTLTEIMQASTSDLQAMAAQLACDARRLVWDRPTEAAKLDELYRKVSRELHERGVRIRA